MDVIVSVIAFIFAILPIAIFTLVVVSLAKSVARAGRGRQGEGSSTKVTSPMTPASRTIRRTEARMDRLDAQHEREDCTFSYSTQDPNFSFNGRQVVDELAELRRKNEAHERHLLARVHRD